MMDNLPRPPANIDRNVAAYLFDLVGAINRGNLIVLKADTPVNGLLMYTPGGSVQKVTVAYDGTLSVELVYDAGS